jgi:hypothetical protein
VLGLAVRCDGEPARKSSAEELRELLIDAVGCSCAPMFQWAYLSVGLDSSIITTIVRSTRQTLRSFSLTFEDGVRREHPPARTGQASEYGSLVDMHEKGRDRRSLSPHGLACRVACCRCTAPMMLSPTACVTRVTRWC